MKPWLVALLALFPAVSHAAAIEGVDFPDTVTVDGATLPVASCGMREFLFANLYGVALYLPPGTPPRAALGPPATPMALSLHVAYDGAIPDRVPQSWRTQFRQEAGRALVADMAGLYRDLQSGDVVTVRYHPATGTTIMRNGRVTVTRPDASPIQGLLDALAGPTATSASLRRELLRPGC